MTDAQPVTARPRRLTKVCWALALVLFAVFAVLGQALRGGPEGAAQFQLADQIAMTLLGLVVGGSALLLTRPRVMADVEGIRFRNVLGFTYLPWQVVSAVRLDDGAPWASLDLQDDDTVALLALQSNDGEPTVDAVIGLRRLLTASRDRT